MKEGRRRGLEWGGEGRGNTGVRLRKGPGVEGRRGEGRGNAAGIEVIEKRALLVKLFFFFF